MGMRFDELSTRAKVRWSDETRQVYQAAVDQFTDEMSERARIGAQFAATRKTHGLTQPELSALTGIQQAEISRIERGAGNPTVTTLLRLADALGARVEVLPG